MDINYKWYTYKEIDGNLMYEILRLRQQIFIVEQNCAYLDCDNLDKKAHHLIGWLNGSDLASPVAYLRLLPPATQSEAFPHAPLRPEGDLGSRPGKLVAIGRVLALQKYRKLGVGRQLLIKGMQRCESLFPDADIRISAQRYLTQFYKSLGFTECSEEYLEDGIPHIEMIKRHIP